MLDDATLLARRAFVHHARELVDANWVRNLGRIRYLDGWEDCVTRDGSIRVSISDSRSSTADLGFKGLYEVSQVTLNTAASDAEILHFFGRVLGLQNEFGFDVAPGPCIACDRHEDCTFADGLSCLADNMCGFDGDHDSIMAAPGCKGIEPWRRLTSWDVIGAQRAYGTKPPGALVYRNSLCVNIPNARVDDVSLIGYPCFSAPNDTWRFSFAATSGESDLLVAAPQGQDRCLTASVSGSALSLTCNRGDPAQNVQMIDMRWRAFGGTCVSPAGASDGSPLYTAECNVNSALQRWTIRDGRFQLSGTSLCASVDSASQDLNVLLKPCDEQDKTQQFVLRTGLIESGNLGCINVFGGDPTPGSKLSVWGFCSDQIENEAFYVTGAIRAGNGCLGMNDESQVTASACSQRSSQEWDYHF